LRTNFGFSLALSGQYQEAIDVLLEAARLVGAGPRTRQNLALVYGLMGDETNARALLSTDLDSASVENNLIVYRALRSLPDIDRRRAVFDVGNATQN